MRERVQRLVGLVSDAAVVNGTINGTHQEATDSEGDTEATATPSAETPKQPVLLGAEQHKDKNKNKKKKKNKKAKAKNKKAKNKKKAEQKSGNG